MIVTAKDAKLYDELDKELKAARAAGDRDTVQSLAKQMANIIRKSGVHNFSTFIRLKNRALKEEVESLVKKIVKEEFFNEAPEKERSVEEVVAMFRDKLQSGQTDLREIGVVISHFENAARGDDIDNIMRLYPGWTSEDFRNAAQELEKLWSEKRQKDAREREERKQRQQLHNRLDDITRSIGAAADSVQSYLEGYLELPPNVDKQKAKKAYQYLMVAIRLLNEG